MELEFEQGIVTYWNKTKGFGFMYTRFGDVYFDLKSYKRPIIESYTRKIEDIEIQFEHIYDEINIRVDQIYTLEISSGTKRKHAIAWWDNKRTPTHLYRVTQHDVTSFGKSSSHEVVKLTTDIEDISKRYEIGKLVAASNGTVKHTLDKFEFATDTWSAS